ncbi:MAG: PAS domain-containing protein [Deltaproteobacteria bacterium]|nr:PAS domain-containing protein [Deltaproteobacteria bacterium]MCB9787941.1 PAS domain-containing protein [Deltaproteobacteria bacterium]
MNTEAFHQLVEQSPTMLWRLGDAGDCQYVNATWLSFTGRQLEDELGDGWKALVHPDDRRALDAEWGAHLARRSAFEVGFRLRRADGTYRHLLGRVSPSTDPEGRPDGFVGSCLDVDAPCARGASCEVDHFFEMSIDNVCVAGFDGYFRRVNASWVRTLGWSREELLSTRILEMVHPDDRGAVVEGRERLRSGGELGPLTNRYRCKDGSYRWFEWRSVAHAERGLIYAAARDVTEQKRAEARLREAAARQEKLERQLVFADRMASVGTLAAGVAHEINNPLAYVTANIDLLAEELDALSPELGRERGAALCEMAADAKAGAARIRTIVRGLKTFSRAEDERRSVIDVLPLLEMSINMTFNEFRHRARLVKDFGPVPRVEADEARLGQVIINLLVNAAQALPEGDYETHEIRVVAATDEAGCAVIEVRDSGVGIPAGLLERVFDPFFTTKPVGVGTGLGLSICHTIVTSMGGTITVTSEEGAGTAFRVTLPAAAAREDAAAPAGAAARRKLACASVLIVDDEPAIGIVLRRLLADHEVTAVTTAAEALALLESGRRYHVILSDLMMPVMSGMEFYQEVSRSIPEQASRVVLVSGGAFTPRAHAFLDAVPNERLDKPFTPSAIRELVQRYCAPQAAAEAGPR